MPNLNSDQTLFVTVLLNVVSYLLMVWKRASDQGKKDWKFNAMWEEYAEKHNIPKNGEKR